MVLNVTEEQKALIESQGYMVVQFKKWCKYIKPLLDAYVGRVIDSFNLFSRFYKKWH